MPKPSEHLLRRLLLSTKSVADKRRPNWKQARHFSSGTLTPSTLRLDKPQLGRLHNEHHRKQYTCHHFSTGSSSAFGDQWKKTRVNGSASTDLSENRDGKDGSTTTTLADIVGRAIWAIQPPRKGSGFDNFTPKGGMGSRTPGKEGDKESSEKSNFSSESDNDKQKSSGGGGGGNTDFDPQFLAVILLLSLGYYLLSRPSQQGSNTSDSSSSAPASSPFSRDISWHDFLRLLQKDAVARIVVTENRETARIYLKPGASLATTAPTSYEERRHFRLQQQKQQDNDAPRSLEAPPPPPSSEDQVQGLGSSGMGSASSSSSHPQHEPFYYSMPVGGSVDSLERKLDEAQRALHRHVDQDVPVQYLPNTELQRELLGLIPQMVLIALAYFAMSWMTRRFFSLGGGGSNGNGGGGFGDMFRIGKSTAKKVAKEDVNVTFKDVAGCDQAKLEVMEFVDFLKDSHRFTLLGAKIPKGALLCGPPGTGKTLLAKAVAGEAGVPFFSISGSDFIEMFVGVGPSRVRDLFREARQAAPCIVFIDEIDAVGRQRGRGGVGGNDERENTLNQLLVEMDGFAPSSGVVVLAGTNRVDILDQALTRPGRFDRQITVDKPDLQGRKDIFLVHLTGITLDGAKEDYAGRLAGLTPGFAGADIANICNEAAIVAARRNGETVTLDDFEKAIDRVIGGLESNKIMSEQERSIVAHHEAGHAVAGWFLEHADPLMKVTIIPRTSGALGYAQYLPKEVFLRTQEQIMDIVCMALAGRAAEDLFFAGRVTTGAQDDLKRVTDLVYSTIQLYGMNARLGQLSFPKDPNAFWDERPYSEKTAKAMDEEARALVDAAYQRTVDLLRDKQAQVKAVAQLLLEKETIVHDDLVELIGERPFAGDPSYQEFVRQKWKQTLQQNDDDDGEKKDEEEGGGTEDKDDGTPAGGLRPEPAI